MVRNRAEKTFKHGAVTESVFEAVAEWTVETDKGVQDELVLLNGTGGATEREAVFDPVKSR